jgi:hypothetical protein
MKEVTCPYCKKEAEWVENKEIYGVNLGKSYMMYLCRPCNAYVGCHNNTTSALGTLANKELREARKKAHKALDPLWQKGRYSRTAVYDMMKLHFGYKVHIGSSDVKMCNDIIEFVKTLS